MPYVQYDPEVLQKFAGKLYARADTITMLYAIAGFFVGLIRAASLGRGSARRSGCETTPSLLSAESW
jgi:hypothetical protein